MRESHRSLQEQYECSHSNLNKLVEISDNFGVGARLTGAGYVICTSILYLHNFKFSPFLYPIFYSWGGCIVAICDSLELSLLYIEELKHKYFKNLPEFSGEEVENVVFVTNPQKGAGIFVDN